MRILPKTPLVASASQMFDIIGSSNFKALLRNFNLIIFMQHLDESSASLRQQHDELFPRLIHTTGAQPECKLLLNMYFILQSCILMYYYGPTNEDLNE